MAISIFNDIQFRPHEKSTYSCHNRQIFTTQKTRIWRINRGDLEIFGDRCDRCVRMPLASTGSGGHAGADLWKRHPLDRARKRFLLCLAHASALGDVPHASFGAFERTRDVPHARFDAPGKCPMPDSVHPRSGPSPIRYIQAVTPRRFGAETACACTKTGRGHCPPQKLLCKKKAFNQQAASSCGKNSISRQRRAAQANARDPWAARRAYASSRL